MREGQEQREDRSSDTFPAQPIFSRVASRFPVIHSHDAESAEYGPGTSSYYNPAKRRKRKRYKLRPPNLTEHHILEWAASEISAIYRR
jgi:hypothetical protein